MLGLPDDGTLENLNVDQFPFNSELTGERRHRLEPDGLEPLKFLLIADRHKGLYGLDITFGACGKKPVKHFGRTMIVMIMCHQIDHCLVPAVRPPLRGQCCETEDPVGALTGQDAHGPATFGHAVRYGREV